MRKNRIRLSSVLIVLVLCAALCVPAFASGGTQGNVSSVVESTWKAAAAQIKTVVNNVVFPALDMVLAIAFFGKLAMSYFDCAPVKVI